MILSIWLFFVALGILLMLGGIVLTKENLTYHDNLRRLWMFLFASVFLVIATFNSFEIEMLLHGANSSCTYCTVRYNYLAWLFISLLLLDVVHAIEAMLRMFKG